MKKLIIGIIIMTMLSVLSGCAKTKQEAPGISSTHAETITKVHNG